MSVADIAAGVGVFCESEVATVSESCGSIAEFSSRVTLREGSPDRSSVVFRGSSVVVFASDVSLIVSVCFSEDAMGKEESRGCIGRSMDDRPGG